MHSPQDHSAFDFYDKMKAPLLLWFIAWTETILFFSLFPSFNIICSGQVAPYKQSAHQRLIVQSDTLSVYCAHIFGN